MPDWLFEGRTSSYVVLIALTAFLPLVWWQTRKRWCLVGAGISCLLIVVYAVLDRTIETDREQIVSAVNSMIVAINAGKVDEAFEHVSDEFLSANGKGKAELRDMARRYLDQKIVTRVDVWDIVCIGEPSREAHAGRAAFQVKVHGQPGVEGFLAECDATFDFDPRFGWRMNGVRLLKPGTTEEWSWQI